MTLEGELADFIAALGPDIKGLQTKTAPITVDGSGNMSLSGNLVVATNKLFQARGYSSASNGTASVGMHGDVTGGGVLFAGQNEDVVPNEDGVFSIGSIVLTIATDGTGLGTWWICTDDTPNTWIRVAGAAPQIIPFASAGGQSVKTGVSRVPLFGSGLILGVKGTLNTAPTGATTFKADVNKNGTTIYGTQANRPTWTASANNATVGAHSVTSYADGDYLTVDVDAVGSTIAGSDLVVAVSVLRLT